MPASRTSILPPPRRCRVWRTSSRIRTLRSRRVRSGRIEGHARRASPGTQPAGRSGGHRRGRDRRSRRGRGRRDPSRVRSPALRIDAERYDGPRCAGSPTCAQRKGRTSSGMPILPPRFPQRDLGGRARRHRKRIRRSGCDQGIHLSVLPAASPFPCNPAAAWPSGMATS